ncbi:MAG: methyltransferase domain-containing protein [Candidatus Pedobacter colombiensis]|uniref:Methyltransferase domain-containing protein n=1 Tax=Candidatus Pedobacter colombiensis TaxID=3121371 RepID=A0AAJ5W949_9SPHI|nr:methyltransferase domain-containing protein [Pedobacter sp.]WEK19421.1 MAG: methyltransferase domain-containing protein [Pedobacter sp.]
MTNSLKTTLKRHLPTFIKRLANRLGLYPEFIPAQGKINWGDFKSVKPFSNDFGFDRGGAVDRYYIEKFLAEQSVHIKGNVLEIADNAYTLKYGGNNVIKSDVLHLNADTPGATYIGDLSKGEGLPSEHFDCIILTQTLHLIYDYISALKHCYRILKKDGILLITTPGISPIDRGEWGKYWLWSFNEHSMRRIFAELFPTNSFTIKTYGNVYAATTFLYGAGIGEVDRSKLDVRDTAFSVIVAIQLKK